MKITAQQLKIQDNRFWSNLCFILSLSPYFYRLGWKLPVNLVNLLKTNLSSHIKIEEIPADNLDNISRFLMKQIFSLPTNYQRPTSLFTSPGDPMKPSWPGFVWGEVTQNNPATIPLTDDHIQLEDIKMFQNKLRIVWANPIGETLHHLQTFYRVKLQKVKAKLAEWSKQLAKKITF